MRKWYSLFYQTAGTYYYVTTDGRILSTRAQDTPPETWHVVATYNGKGYRRVRLQGKTFKVHRLVADAFLPNPDHLPYVLHLDGDRTNNNVSNLCWSARQSNHPNNPAR